MVVVFFLFSSVILLTSLQPGKWNFIVFVLRTYFFLTDDGAEDVFGFVVEEGFTVVFGFGVEVGLGVGDDVAETKGSALDTLIRFLNVSDAVESAVIVMRPASVKG